MGARNDAYRNMLTVSELPETASSVPVADRPKQFITSSRRLIQTKFTICVPAHRHTMHSKVPGFMDFSRLSTSPPQNSLPFHAYRITRATATAAMYPHAFPVRADTSGTY